MLVFLTGATGYIGGSVGVALVEAGHDVRGLVRSDDGAKAVKALGMVPVRGTLDDGAVLAREAAAADAVINTADAEHAGAVRAMLGPLEGSGKAFLHTSGSSIVGTQAGGALVEDVFDEETKFTPTEARAGRVALDREVRAAAGREIRTVILCPSLIYGEGRGVNRHSMQVPWLIETARRLGCAGHPGPGTNRWSNVHVDDLVTLYLLALEDAPAGAFYFAENGEASMGELCAAINRMLGIDAPPRALTSEEAAAEWGEGPALNTMGSNSRVRAVRARRELGWQPAGRSVTDEILHGCYAAEAPE